MTWKGLKSARKAFPLIQVHSCLSPPPACLCAGLAGHTAIQDLDKGKRQKPVSEGIEVVSTPAARPVFLFSLGASREQPAQPLALPAPEQAGDSSHASAAELVVDDPDGQNHQDQEEPPHTFELGFAWDSMLLDVFVQVTTPSALLQWHATACMMPAAVPVRAWQPGKQCPGFVGLHSLQEICTLLG